MNEIVFLGYVVSGNEIFINPRKVEAIVKWEHPKNVIEIQSFLGLIEYYKWFVEHFSLTVAPLTQLTRKWVKFECNEKCEQNFQELKDRFIFASILTLSTIRAGYVVFSDASRQGLGCILMQDGGVISNTS